MGHPLFLKYNRAWLHGVTGYSRCYLNRVASGRCPLTRAFIERVCERLQLPAAELFLPDPEVPGSEESEVLDGRAAPCRSAG